MNYQVTVHNSSNIGVTIPSAQTKKKIVDVDTSNSSSISDSSDVNTTSRQNNSILIWNATTQKHEYISPSNLLDIADGVNDDAIDYGTY